MSIEDITSHYLVKFDPLVVLFQFECRAIDGLKKLYISLSSNAESIIMPYGMYDQINLKHRVLPNKNKRVFLRVIKSYKYYSYMHY